MIDSDSIEERFASLSPHLDERGRRLTAAAEAAAAGRGGIAAVSRATGIAVSTIGRGLSDLSGDTPLEAGRIRRAGGGRKPLTETKKGLLPALLALIEPDASGDPMSDRRRTSMSLRRMARELATQGFGVSYMVVSKLVKSEKISLQGNRKTREGEDHPDRDAQFLHIKKKVRAALKAGQPVISVDTKKKELVGDFKNNGREWRPKGQPEEVRVHDFLIKELGRAVPYGVYDLAANAGWVSVGMSCDTAAFAVQTIRRWWQEIGAKRYPDAGHLTITADGGGSNASRSRLWKRELQKLANEIGITINVHHLPPGTSKWNKIVVRQAHHEASPVLVHQHELAGQAFGQLPCHRRSDQCDHHRNRPDGSLRTQPHNLSKRHHHFRQGNGRNKYRPRQISRRMELFD